MLTLLTTAAEAASPLTYYGPGPGPGGFGWLWLLVPLFWIAFFVLLVAFVGRRLRRGGAAWQMHGPSPEQTLGDRYARGEIDEQEYRSRLEVLRANQPQRRQPRP
ncbi:SHOCT domain-containing protein [Planctomonas deserti]|uniref:SHOCT domain-containing protein n=1 Tax=Planctomonas deserti TaxID=2144185 RepID=UPI001F0CB61F|nr:SHOCT domain-containing protein [Planctomonas deserti]